MSKNGFLVVDDGSPESSDYDDNYVFYDLDDADSYEAALQEVRRRCAVLKRLYPKLSCACSTLCACQA